MLPLSTYTTNEDIKLTPVTLINRMIQKKKKNKTKKRCNVYTQKMFTWLTEISTSRNISLVRETIMAIFSHTSYLPLTVSHWRNLWNVSSIFPSCVGKMVVVSNVHLRACIKYLPNNKGDQGKLDIRTTGQTGCRTSPVTLLFHQSFDQEEGVKAVGSAILINRHLVWASLRSLCM